MDDKTYRAHPAFGSTDIKVALNEGPHVTHFRRGNQAERKETPAMRMGTLIHCAILEPEEMSARYAEPYQPHPAALSSVSELKAALTDDGMKGLSKLKKGELEQAIRERLPGVILATDHKAHYERQCEGKTILTDDERDEAHAWIQAVSEAFPDAAQWRTEVPLIAEGIAPVALKAKLDGLDEENGIVWDVKTTTARNTQTPEGWAKVVESYGYHMQAAQYARIAAANGIKVKAFGWLVLRRNSEGRLPCAEDVSAYILRLDEEGDGRNWLGAGWLKVLEGAHLLAGYDPEDETPKRAVVTDLAQHRPAWAWKKESK